jgi:hypothetical protein
MPAAAKVTPTGNGDPPAQEDAMTFKFPAATKLMLSLAAACVFAIGLSVTQADAQTTKRKPTVVNSAVTTNGNSTAYGPAGPNRSYQSGPRTRVFVTTRSWLDAGVEVLPGDRKFNDYAFPQSRSFALENNNRPLDRQPLYPAYDLGGYPTNFPLY